MNYDQFHDAVSQAGLEARRRLVNVWPNTKRGFCFQPFGKPPHRGAQLEDAIEAARPHRAASTPAWQVIEIIGQPTSRSSEVGIIRRFWRWMW